METLVKFLPIIDDTHYSMEVYTQRDKIIVSKDVFYSENSNPIKCLNDITDIIRIELVSYHDFVKCGTSLTIFKKIN